MFNPFFDFLAGILNFMYKLLFHNYGLAIMGLTVLVMAVITPLTIKSTKSMLQMQRLQPEMKRLQNKYKDDREKLNAELMAFYKENQINPLGGCLPVVVQMPVFMVMYRLLRGLTNRQGGTGSGAGRVIGQSASGDPLTPWIYTKQLFRPDHLAHTTELYQALSHTNRMKFLGMDLSLSASQVIKNSLLLAIPYFVLLLIMLFTGIYQNKQLQSRNTGGNVNPQQQAIMKAMPFFLPVFSFGFPAGLALYWCTQNFCRIGTNAYITRSLYRKDHEGDIETTGTEVSTSKTPKVGKGGDQKALPASGKNSGSNGSKNGKTTKTSKDSGSTSANRSPGKSAKSQAAHSKKSGPASSTPRNGSGGSSGRKSGEPRGGTGDQKKG